MIKNKVIERYDYRKLIIPERLMNLTINSKTVERCIADVAGRFITIEEVFDEVKKEDIISILQNGNPVEINVGKGFYNTKFEESLMGMNINEKRRISYDEKEYEVMLLQIKRRIYPPVTDELVACMNIEGIHSIESYKEVIERELVIEEKDKKQQALETYVMKKVVENSKFADISEEISQEVNQLKRCMHSMAMHLNGTYEQMLQDYCPKSYKTSIDREKYIEEKAALEVKEKMIGALIAEECNVEVNKNRYHEMVEEQLKSGFSQEQIDAEYTYEVYEKMMFIDAFRSQILDYYNPMFRVVRN
jgi:hypothetical protein